MVIGRDPLGLAIIRPTATSDASRHELRKAVHNLLPECPAAIIVDLSKATHVPKLVQMTLLSLVIEAGQEPATPLVFCATNAQAANDLTQVGRTMRVFPSLSEARHALITPTPSTAWIHRPLGSGSDAPSAAAGHVAEACLAWRLPEEQMTARNVALHLVSMARGPYELHLTVSLRRPNQLLINVRNYSTAAKSSPDRVTRMSLSPQDEARLLAMGATGCGRLVNGAGVAWWAILNGREPS